MGSGTPKSHRHPDRMKKSREVGAFLTQQRHRRCLPLDAKRLEGEAAVAALAMRRPEGVNNRNVERGGPLFVSCLLFVRRGPHAKG